MRVVSPDICRPFSKGRSGMNLGEGGAILVLESEEAASARGARIYAEVVGFGMSADAGHIVAPSGEGATLAMKAALDDGGVSAGQVGYVNAHGTGTEINDQVECAAIRQALGSAAEKTCVSSTKGAHGHALGGAGALEAVATVLAIHDKRLPATANYLGKTPECDLDIVHDDARQLSVEVALSNAFAFGGLNAVLAFRRAS